MKKFEYKDIEIRIVIEEDIIGYYLAVYCAPSFKKSKEDYLLDTEEEAFTEAKLRFGIKKESFHLLQD